VGFDQERVGALDAEYLIKRFKEKKCNVFEIDVRLGPFRLDFGTRDFEITP
jgi:hypothetical protein